MDPLAAHRMERQAYRPMVEAISNGATRKLENALDSGLGVDGCPKRGFQPLMMAACLGHMPAVELLIAKGADVNLPFCTDHLEPELVNTKPHSHGARPLHGAAMYCKIDIVLLLIRAGAEVNATDIHGCTPLHRLFPSTDNEPPQVRCDIAKALLSAGADPRLVDGKRALPLHCAADCGNIGAIDLLLKAAPETGPGGWDSAGEGGSRRSCRCRGPLARRGRFDSCDGSRLCILPGDRGVERGVCTRNRREHRWIFGHVSHPLSALVGRFRGTRKNLAACSRN